MANTIRDSFLRFHFIGKVINFPSQIFGEHLEEETAAKQESLDFHPNPVHIFSKTPVLEQWQCNGSKNPEATSK